MGKTNFFKIWDYDANGWLPQDEYGSVLQFNWYIRGDYEGLCWAEIKHLPGRTLDIVCVDTQGNYERERP